MSQTHADELLLAIREFLRQDVLPQLEGFSAYTARVAANSLGIVARQLQLQPELDRLDAQALTAYGIEPGNGALQQLALKLRNGEVRVDATLVHYLQQRTLKSLAIDNPRYSGYLAASKRWQTEAEKL